MLLEINSSSRYQERFNSNYSGSCSSRRRNITVATACLWIYCAFKGGKNPSPTRYFYPQRILNPSRSLGLNEEWMKMDENQNFLRQCPSMWEVMVTSNLLPNALPWMPKGAAALHFCCSLVFGTKGPEDTLLTRTAGNPISLWPVGCWSCPSLLPTEAWEV